MFKELLTHPLTRGLEIDSAEATALRRLLIRNKPFLNRIYQEWYALIVEALPVRRAGPVLELGSGGGFLKHYLPDLITSDILFLPSNVLVADGNRLPFADIRLDAIVMTNAFHHLPRPREFLAEAVRCVRPGGRIIMIEPWVTGWSRLVYGRLHHEPFEPGAAAWEFPKGGPLSSANGGLPWIIFERDRPVFEKEFPELRIGEIFRFMPFRYLLSGGVSMRSLAPGWTFDLWRRLEGYLCPWMGVLAMFAEIVLERVWEAE